MDLSSVCFFLCFFLRSSMLTIDGNGEGVPLSLIYLRFVGFELCVLFLYFFLRSSLLTTGGWRFPMFLVMADTRVGEALYPNFRDLKFFPRLIGLMVDGWLLHPNMMYLPVISLFSSLAWFTWRSVPDASFTACGNFVAWLAPRRMWAVTPWVFWLAHLAFRLSTYQVCLEVVISVSYWEA